jgi:hypothetical protein
MIFLILIILALCISNTITIIILLSKVFDITLYYPMEKQNSTVRVISKETVKKIISQANIPSSAKKE